MQVHDELVFEVAREEVVQYEQEIRGLMSVAASLRVPLVVDTGIGRQLG